MPAAATNITATTGQGSLPSAHLFTGQERVKACESAGLTPAEVAKHKEHRLYAMTLPLGPSVLAVAGEAPPRVKLFGFGETTTTKGTFYLTEADSVGILKAEEDYGNDLVVDLDHRALFGDSKAVGWFSLELDADGLYAGAPRHTGQEQQGIWWLAEGKSLIEGYQYRYISPVFWTHYDDQGREVIVEVLNFSLTNIPATKNRAPLINSRGEESTEMPPIETTISATTAPAQQPAPEGILAAVYALTGETDAEKVKGKLAALAELKALLEAEKAAHTLSKGQLKELKVKLAILEGKLPPANREKALAMSEAAFEGYLEGLSGHVPSAHRVVEQPALNSDNPAAPATALSKDEQEICSQYKLPPALYAANKAKLYPRTAVATDRFGDR